jgi:hypothetical protein
MGGSDTPGMRTNVTGPAVTIPCPLCDQLLALDEVRGSVSCDACRITVELAPEDKPSAQLAAA